jgi:hypothetical protein
MFGGYSASGDSYPQEKADMGSYALNNDIDRRYMIITYITTS